MDEDNSLGDGEEPRNRQPHSPKMGGKKIKLNDGTSQESLQDGQEAEEYNETHFWSTPFVGLEEIGKKTLTTIKKVFFRYKYFYSSFF